MKIYTLTELLKDRSEAPKPLIGEGILHKNDILLIAGSKKSRKTFLAYNLGVALATGKGFAGFKIDSKYKVLMFSAEGGYFPNRDRFHIIGNGMESPDSDNFEICLDSRLKIDNDKNYEELKEHIVDHSIDVLIIDPFIKFHHKDENKAQDMIFILETLRFLTQDYLIALILVHHQGKEASLGARGSSAIQGEYDSCITTTKIGGDDSLHHKIEFDLRHSISPESRNLIFNQETNWFDLDISPTVFIISKFGSLSKQELVDKLISEGHYKHPSGAYKTIDRDIKRGLIFLHSDEKYNITTVQ